MPRLADQLRRRNARRACEHIDGIGEPAEPRAAACEECGVQRSLRVCLSCGHVGCCDSSSGHATAHARKTGHPVIRALPNGFTFCYPHREYF
jgi:CPA1 family monovalent cation:H+ antiporter